MEEGKNQSLSSEQEGEVKDRGLFDFMKKKEEGEKSEEAVLIAGVENIHVTEVEKVEEKKEEEKKEGFLEKLHRSHSSSSSSSSDEEEGEGGEKKEKKKKKGLKEKVKEKLGCEKKENEDEEKKTTLVAEEEVVTATAVTADDDTSITVEKVDESIKLDVPPEEEKKGFLEKMKEKLPGHKKPNEEAAPPASEPVVYAKEQETDGHDGKEKKGIFGKIMEKLPGYHKGGEEKETEKTGASH
ncbi:dehydrin COR410-like [Typha angustifolia]|uniref:dehydrin COR410-like n=1 Tax=Typha angustifolia TaxID=59011 RepID=UPI003C2CC822